MVRSWGVFSTWHWFLNFQNPEGTCFHVNSATECLCDLAWDTVPLWTSFLPLKKIEDLLLSCLRSLPSLICWNSGILESPKNQQHPGHPCSLLTSSEQRAEEGGKTHWWLQSEASVPENFGIQIILKLAHKGLFLTKQCCAAISWGVNWGILLALCEMLCRNPKEILSLALWEQDVDSIESCFILYLFIF